MEQQQRLWKHLDNLAVVYSMWQGHQDLCVCHALFGQLRKSGQSWGELHSRHSLAACWQEGERIILCLYSSKSFHGRSSTRALEGRLENLKSLDQVSAGPTESHAFHRFPQRPKRHWMFILEMKKKL